MVPLAEGGLGGSEDQEPAGHLSSEVEYLFVNDTNFYIFLDAW